MELLVLKYGFIKGLFDKDVEKEKKERVRNATASKN